MITVSDLPRTDMSRFLSARVFEGRTQGPARPDSRATVRGSNLSSLAENLSPVVTGPEPVGNPLEAALREERALAADLLLRDLQDPVEANPALTALLVPLARADGQPTVVRGVVRVGGDEKPQNGCARPAYDEDRAFLRGSRRRPHPHDLTGVSLAVHIGGKEDGTRAGFGLLNPNLRGLADGRAASVQANAVINAAQTGVQGVGLANGQCPFNSRPSGWVRARHVDYSKPMSKNFAATTFTDPARIRNFCIIAHIDHGKSTLADRILQLSQVVEERDMRDQYLDNMDIERERGITIKAQNVRLPWIPRSGPFEGQEIVMQMIDTPGHVDFTYEVSRALEACEGAILLVDAAQGIEAQTLANLYLAMENDLEIIPVLNKIDLPAADPEKYSLEIANIIGCEPEDVLRVSGKTGEGVDALLDKVAELVPAPTSDFGPDAPARAMIFDSIYDTYRGVVTYIRMVDGTLKPRQKVTMMSTGANHELLEVGIVSPTMQKCEGLGPGEVGYLITGVKDVRETKVGDTVTWASGGAEEPLEGYADPKPMVYSGLFPISQADFPDLRDALEKLQLNDASLTYEPETSVALGFGFRCGFLGLLHMEITRDRLEREFDLDLISTAPSVTYRVVGEDGAEQIIHNPSDWPEGKLREVYEPVVKTTIIVPADFVGPTMELCQSKRGQMGGMDYLSEDRVELRYTMPLGEIIFDFFDQLKSRTKGYASLNYEDAGEQLADLVKVDILLNGDPVDAFSAIVHRDSAQWYGNKMTKKLKELIPRQQFEVPVQASIGSKVIARENIRAMRKDVLAKCYGGDISRKRKLLEKQKAGKKRMKSLGSVSVPQEAFVAALSTDDD